MKNTQRGLIGIAIIILVALAAIGGGAYVYTQNKVPKTAVVETVLTDNSEKVVDNNTPESVTTTRVVVTPPPAPVTTTVTTNNTTATSGISGQDCGTIVDSHVIFEGDKRTAAEITALKCLSQKVLSCAPAYLNVTGEDAGKYIVFNKSDENCVIGVTFNGNKQCEIPVEVISDLEKYAKEEGELIEDLIIPLTFLIAVEKTNNAKTGEAINVSCQSF